MSYQCGEWQMGTRYDRRKFLRITAATGGVALASGIGGLPGIPRSRSAYAANEVPVGSLRDETGLSQAELPEVQSARGCLDGGQTDRMTGGIGGQR
jgi:hypothetical protein